MTRARREPTKTSLDVKPVIQTVLGGASLAFVMWISTTLIEIKAKVDSPTIPVQVENALNELRARLNNDQLERNKLSEIAIGNAKDIGYLKERLPRPSGEAARPNSF